MIARARRLRVAVVGLAWACACQVGVAHAQPSLGEQAHEHFGRGEAADHDHRYADAIEEYEAAYAIAPHPDVLYNIAVDHEHLEHWAQAAEMFQRYLDERDTPAQDASAVTARIRELRVKARAAASRRPVEPAPPRVAPEPDGRDTLEVQPPPPSPPPDVAVPPPGLQYTRWHIAASYGIADGNAPSERYQLRGGIDVARHLDIDAVAGAFGNNDYAAGAMLRLVVAPDLRVKPFLLGAATIGIAKQDASSRAGTRLPIGVEAGGGVQFGAHGRIELDAVVRYLAGGWGAADTTAFSYANDAVAVAFDLGIAFDVPVISAAR